MVKLLRFSRDSAPKRTNVHFFIIEAILKTDLSTLYGLPNCLNCTKASGLRSALIIDSNEEKIHLIVTVSPYTSFCQGDSGPGDMLVMFLDSPKFSPKLKTLALAIGLSLSINVSRHATVSDRCQDKRLGVYHLTVLRSRIWRKMARTCWCGYQ